MLPDQIAVFEGDAVEQFVEEMADHCETFAPALCRTLDRETLRDAARRAMQRAKACGMTLRGPIRLILEMMILLGDGFQDDPQYAWAQETLKREDFFNEMFKSGRLERQVRDYLVAVNGKDDEHAVRALLRLRRLAQSEAADPRIRALLSDHDDLLSRIFPEKHAHLGPGPVAAMSENAHRLAAHAYGPSVEPRATALLFLLSCAFGHRCDQDPLYPWIGRTLYDAERPDWEVRADRLERHAVTWMNAVLKPQAA